MAKDRTSASTNQKRRAQVHRPIRSVGRTSASTNQKRRAQAHRPIRSVPKGQHKRTNHQRVSRSREGATQPIRFVWQGALADASSHQKESSDQPTRSIDRSISDGLIWTDFLRTNFLSADPPSSRNCWISQPDPLIGVFRTDYLRTDFLWANFLSVRNPKIGPAHEWSQTTRVTRSPSPPEYDTSSKETVVNGGRSRSTHTCRTFTCAISRLRAKDVHCKHKSYIVRTSRFERISRLRAKAVRLRTH